METVEEIWRRISVAHGEFDRLFREVEVPPLPEAVTRLVAEITKPDPSIEAVERFLSGVPRLPQKVIKTVNSTMFGLRSPVRNLKHAVTLMGLPLIHLMALGYATMDALPRPKGDLFDPEAFWTDSLFKAMLSRAFSRKKFADQMEEGFTASLLADVALPVLLCAWEESYEPLVEAWRESPLRLSEIERQHFGWDHAQAGAWIAQSWAFPREIICYIGVHSLSWEKICELELQNTLVTPMAVASSASSVLKPDSDRSVRVFTAAVEWLSMKPHEFIDCIADVMQSYREMLEIFGLPDRAVGLILKGLMEAADSENQEEET